jgi:hypothetical protein
MKYAAVRTLLNRVKRLPDHVCGVEVNGTGIARF